MGYELDRLMERYGVRTPVLAQYTGTMNPEPYKSQLTDANYQEALAKYRADREAYRDYRLEYERRLRDTPMYGDVPGRARLNNPEYSGYQFVPPSGPPPGPTRIPTAAPAPAPAPAPAAAASAAPAAPAASK